MFPVSLQHIFKGPTRVVFQKVFFKVCWYFSAIILNELHVCGFRTEIELEENDDVILHAYKFSTLQFSPPLEARILSSICSLSWTISRGFLLPVIILPVFQEPRSRHFEERASFIA